MPFVVAGVGAALFLLLKPSESKALDGIPELTPMTKDKTRSWGLKDVEPSEQSGGYKTDYDIYFEAAADEFDVPFALLKAHAIQESSLKEKAFRNENPSNRADREGWASRGLLQLLWAPDKNNSLAKNKLYDRFKKYGYSGDTIGNGDLLFKPDVNTRISAQLIRDNLKSCGGSIRDAINMYNAGVKESVRQAPEDYVGKVLKYYNKIIGEV